MDRRFNRCCTLSSVDLPLIYRGAQTDDKASDLSTTIGCTDAYASVKPVPLFSAELVQCIATINFHYAFTSLWWIGLGVSTIDWTLRLDDELDMLTHIHGA